jgi:UDP-N-acetyl-D-mannosaminuronic acid dehydrogenase
MKVSVIGLGYIGLPTAAVLASHQINVVGVDIDSHVVSTINQGKIHIVEPGLEDLVRTAVQTGRLKATTQIEESDVFVIAVPTPFKGNHEPDLSYIKSAAKMISSVLNEGNIVILESTSPVGTTEKMVGWMQEARTDLTFPLFGRDADNFDIYVSHCPERVLPGNVLRELVDNDRIIGGITTECAERSKEFYDIFVKGSCITTDCRTAELSKLVENSFRDVNIAFANELSLICDKLDIDVWKLIELANRHPRVDIMRPGPGVGGHCIAVDPWFIIDSAPNESNLIHISRIINDNKPKFILDKINSVFKSINKPLSEISVACLGLSFKPDIDDLRASPAMEIVHSLTVKKIKKIYVIEPNISSLPDNLDIHSVELSNIEDGIKFSDVVLILVAHKEFLTIDKKLLMGKKVVDSIGIT